MFYRTCIIRGMDVINICKNCKKDLSDKPKASYCSDRCRIAYTRRLKKGEQPEQKEPEQPTRTFNFKPTRTDREFEKETPGFYNFHETEYDKDCFVCGEKFKTHLQLLKFCSLKCKKEFYFNIDTRNVGKEKS